MIIALSSLFFHSLLCNVYWTHIIIIRCYCYFIVIYYVRILILNNLHNSQSREELNLLYLRYFDEQNFDKFI